MASTDSKPASSDTTAAKADSKPAEADSKKKTLVVRLLADYWDKDGVRRSCAYIDDNGEKHATGALIELPAEEARQLVKTSAAERGDEY